MRPDLSACCKAIANGHALAAVTGTDRFREAAQQIFVTGSFWCSARRRWPPRSPPSSKLRDTAAIAHMARIGRRFCATASTRRRAAYGLGAPPDRPGADAAWSCSTTTRTSRRATSSPTEALKRGVYMHPWHNMFLSAAHTEADIDEALFATDRALRVVADRLPEEHAPCGEAV